MKSLVGEVYLKAKSLIRKHEEKQKEFMTCLKAGICPTCGKPLVVKDRGSSDKNHVVCEKGCPLVSPGGVDFKTLDFEVWETCINNKIKEAFIY